MMAMTRRNKSLRMLSAITRFRPIGGAHALVLCAAAMLGGCGAAGIPLATVDQVDLGRRPTRFYASTGVPGTRVTGWNAEFLA